MVAVETKDFVIENGIVAPCEGRRELFDPGSVLVLNGKIEAVGPTAEIANHPAVKHVEHIDASKHLIIPGLHNLHLHSGCFAAPPRTSRCGSGSSSMSTLLTER